MVFLIVVATLFAGYGTAYLASEDVRYLTRAGIEETRILEGRKPIAHLVADDATDPVVRRSLDLVLQSRDYAARLGLNAKETYTTYSDVGRDTLLLVLQAAPKDCICPYTWKYPVVGRIPYKGFFDLGAGKRAAVRLAAQGYDVYLRPSGAFSTLGWFNDPLLSTALTRDSVELAALVFHEIAHNTLYVKSATPFNESFAQFVGYRSAESFFTEHGDTANARLAEDRLHDEMILGEFYESLTDRLNRLYATKPDSVTLENGRAEAGAWAREQLTGPVGARLRTFRLGTMPERPVNNARLIGARIYRTRLDLFDRWFERHDRDVRRSVSALGALMEGAEGDSAYARLESAVADSAGSPKTDAPATE
ncbi:MAG: aminopeptidase [Gemmatimonadales bacterium]